ncbi:MAG: ASCH domain-containing protein [Candidatus Pacearchaeota archaeon]|jgi:hypothetical protein
MIRKITFSEPLPKLILTGEKTSTWRIDEPVPIKRTSDTEGIKVGDKLSLVNKNQKEFAKAITIKVNHIIFGKLTKSDLEGHEKFKSKKEMYNKFSEYYKIKVNDKTKIVVIKFKLLK